MLASSGRHAFKMPRCRPHVNHVVVGCPAAVHLGAMCRDNLRFFVRCLIVSAVALWSPAAACATGDAAPPALADARHSLLPVLLFGRRGRLDARRGFTHRWRARRGGRAGRQQPRPAGDGDRGGSEQHLEWLCAAAARSSADLSLAHAPRPDHAARQRLVERSTLDPRVCAHRAAHARVAQSGRASPHASLSREARAARGEVATVGDGGLCDVCRGAHRAPDRTPHGIWRAAVLRQWAIEGQLPTYAALDGSGRFEGGDMAYLAGSAFLEWLASSNGDSSVVHLWRRMSARQARTFAEAFAGVYGAPPDELYGKFAAALTHDALDAVAGGPQHALLARGADSTSRPGEGELVQRLQWGTGAPSISRDDSLLAIVLARSEATRARRDLVALPAAGGERRASRRGARAGGGSGGRESHAVASAAAARRRRARRTRRSDFRRAAILSRRRPRAAHGSRCPWRRCLPRRPVRVELADRRRATRDARRRHSTRRRESRRSGGDRRSLRVGAVRSRARESRDWRDRVGREWEVATACTIVRAGRRTVNSTAFAVQSNGVWRLGDTRDVATRAISRADDERNAYTPSWTHDDDSSPRPKREAWRTLSDSLLRVVSRDARATSPARPSIPRPREMVGYISSDCTRVAGISQRSSLIRARLAGQRKWTPPPATIPGSPRSPRAARSIHSRSSRSRRRATTASVHANSACSFPRAGQTKAKSAGLAYSGTDPIGKLTWLAAGTVGRSRQLARRIGWSGVSRESTALGHRSIRARESAIAATRTRRAFCTRRALSRRVDLVGARRRLGIAFAQRARACIVRHG